MTARSNADVVRENVEEMRTRIVQLGGEEDFSPTALAALAEMERERAEWQATVKEIRESDIPKLSKEIATERVQAVNFGEKAERRRIVAILEGMRQQEVFKVPEYGCDANANVGAMMALGNAIARIQGGDDA